MNIILLSGGSGKRLWPLSNDIRSKQFLQLFRRADGAYESMIQRVYRQLNNIGIQTHITVATNEKQVPEIYKQLGKDVDVCVEPVMKDTFPAIALSAAYLVDQKGVKPTESIVVCPVDPMVTSEYFRALIALQYQSEVGKSNIVLMGMEPSYATDKYGYIIPSGDGKLETVKSFKEKPSREQAQKLMEEGALWNGGVFALKLKYILDKSQEILGYRSYKDLLSHYEKFNEISFDYAVVEKEPNIQVMRFSGEWADMGTWSTLTKAMTDTVVGNGVIDDSSSGVQILNELDVPVLAMGLHNVVISASKEGILVSDKESSSNIKPFVDDFEQMFHVQKAQRQILPDENQEVAPVAPVAPVEDMAQAAPAAASNEVVEEKSWGSLKIMDTEEDSKTLKLTLKEGSTMSYHSHKGHDEIWVVLSGEGQAILDEKRNDIKKGDIITMKAGCKHTITAVKEMKLIEIQLGEDVSENDKQKFDLAKA